MRFTVHSDGIIKPSTTRGKESIKVKVQESRENYLEAILILTQRNGFVRSIDVANFMDFSKPSVSVAMSNLKSALLVTVDDAGGIHLTDAGRAMAQQVYERHRTLTAFLKHIGVDEITAADDACRIEHVISQLSFEKIRDFTRQIGVVPMGESEAANAERK